MSSTAQARVLIDAVAFGGARQLVLAGGDPSLRRDLDALLEHAHDRGLRTEVQTNAQFQGPAVRTALARADLVGLSLDGPTPEVHDAFRGKRGNFARVLRLADFLESRGRPFVVRSVAARPNAEHLPRLAEVLRTYRHLRRWAVVQFSPIEEGYRNRLEFELADATFASVASRCADAYDGPAEMNLYPNARKGGTYCQLAPDGHLFGSLSRGPTDAHTTIGRITEDHLATLAAALDFDPERHHTRYGTLM